MLCQLVPTVVILTPNWSARSCIGMRSGPEHLPSAATTIVGGESAHPTRSSPLLLILSTHAACETSTPPPPPEPPPPPNLPPKKPAISAAISSPITANPILLSLVIAIGSSCACGRLPLRDKPVRR